MASYFRSGSKEIENGAIEVTVTGLALDFTPGSAQVSVRQPSVEADIITAYVVGAPTTDGFTALLSSPVTQTGYRLDWSVFSASGSQPVDTGTLAADYTTIKREVARFLGYDHTSLTEKQIADIDDFIQSGIRQFYYPPSIDGMEPGFEWDFLRQNGSVATTDGVSEYLLPDGFGHFTGQLVFADSEARHTVPIIPYGDILAMLNANPMARDRPRFAATVSQNAYGEKGQRRKLYLFPTPDKAYTLKFTCASDTGKIDADVRPFPLGGPMYAELVIESCLAIAEQKANDEQGQHTAKFQQLLAAMMPTSRRTTGQVFGSVGDPDAWRW